MATMMNIGQQIQSRCMSSRYARQLSTKIDLEKTLKNTNKKPTHAQDFVKVRLTPGEGDPYAQAFPHKRKPNPLLRPKWRHKAEVISKEDFQARPKVIFDEQFDSLYDGMIVLTWLDEQQRQDIYEAYLQMMIEQEQEFKTTSHEYVMRVIAEKFNLSTMRVAAIVQNCHDEEQAKKNGDPDMIHEDIAKYKDEMIKETIAGIYDEYGEKNPIEYVEQPVGSIPLFAKSGELAKVEDLYDVDDLTRKAIIREQEEAQLMIDNKIYVEDVDLDKIESKVNAECLNLMKRANEEFKELRDSFQRKDNEIENALPDGGMVEDKEGNKTKAERRPRWKYVANTINVRERKKKEKERRMKGKRAKKKFHKDNTIVEHDGVVRVASMEEVMGTAWKPMKNEHEKTYEGVKASWMKRTLNGEKGVWGRMEDNRHKEEKDDAKDDSASEDEPETDEDTSESSEAGETSKDDKEEK